MPHNATSSFVIQVNKSIRQGALVDKHGTAGLKIWISLQFANTLAPSSDQRMNKIQEMAVHILSHGKGRGTIPKWMSLPTMIFD